MSTAVTEDHAADAPAKQADKRRVLDSLSMEARTTSAKATARSQLVRQLRIALPVLALVLVAALIFNTQSNDADEAFLKDFEDVAATAEELRMASPRFAGIDANGRPFEITADAALQNTNNDDVVMLEGPRAVQGHENETNVVTAHKGVYRSEANILELTDDVTLEHKIGADTYIFRSPSATVSIDEEIVTSNAGIGGNGPERRTLQADRMKAYNGEGRVVLEGNVHMRIYPKDDENPGEHATENENDKQHPPLKE